MQVGRFSRDLTLLAVVIMFQDLEDLASVRDFQQVAVGCICAIFWTRQSGTSIFLLLWPYLRFTIFAWIYSTFYLVKSSGIFTGTCGILPVKHTSNSFSDKSNNFLSSGSSLKWFRLNWNYWTEIKSNLPVIPLAWQTLAIFFSNISLILIGDSGPSKYPLIISGVICLNWVAIWDATKAICLRTR